MNIRRYTNTPKRGGDSMSAITKRALVTLRPEWESDLDRLKQEKFYDKTQSEMFRYLIQLGLNAQKQNQQHKAASGN